MSRVIRARTTFQGTSHRNCRQLDVLWGVLSVGKQERGLFIELKETRTSTPKAFKVPVRRGQTSTSGGGYVPAVERGRRRVDTEEDESSEILDEDDQQHLHAKRPNRQITSSSNSSSSMSLETALVDNDPTDSKSRPSNIHKFTDFAKTRTGELAAKTINIKSGDRRYDHLRSGSSSSGCMCCCSRKCVCLMIVLAFTMLDLLLNAFFVTYSFTRLPSLGGRAGDHYDLRLSLVDIWGVSLLRDLVLMVVVSVAAVRHHAIYRFIKFLHRSYLTAFLCLVMYSLAMAKMLLHADQRPQPDQTNMAMMIWNIVAAFGFFLSFYMLALLKLKKANYSKTDVDGGDIGENGGEEDAFIETLKETNKKRSSLMRIFKYAGPDLHIILAGTFFLVTGAICEAFVPYYTGQVLDSITVQRNFDHFKKHVILFIGANFASGMLGGLRTCLFSVAVARLNVRLRRLVFKALIDQDISFFDKINTGEMISRLTADTTTMSDLISQNLNGFLWNFVRTIGTLMFILKLSWQLSLTCFIGAPIVFSVGKLFGNYYKKLSSRVQKCMADANHVAEQSLSTIRTVRSFANEDGETSTYANRLKDMLKLKIKQALVQTSYDWTVKIAELLMTVAMLGYGAYLVTTSQISSGDFISFVIFQLTLGQCLEGLTSVYTGLMNAAGASEKIFEYIDIKPELQVERAFKPDQFGGKIEFRNVSFTYPTRPDAPVLQNVSFTVRPGEIVALVGPSGSGKSSCINLLERFYKPDRGEILIDGFSLFDYNHKYIHRVIALVGQEPVLYAKKIRENIAYGLVVGDECTDEDIVNAAKMANAYNFIMETPNQFDTDCGERGTQLSGGQKQRIAIARALIRKPNILLLDEATSALDAESEYLVQQAIHKNLKGRTVVVVAHRLSTIENADKIIVLDHGQIVEQGTHRELLKQNGLYSQLVNKQIMHGADADSTVGSKSGTSTPSLAYFPSPNRVKHDSFHTSV